MNTSELKQTNETFRPETIELVSLNVLRRAYKRVVDLGEKGKELVSKNQFGDTALRADIEAEETIISALELAKIPLVLLSEEHGRIEIGKEQKLLGVLDGIDGSGLFKKDRKNGRYGTMFAVYQGTNPTYNDYLFGGIMEHATKRLFFGTKGKGAFVITNGITQPIHCSDTSVFEKQTTRIEPDVNFDGAYHTKIINGTFLSKLEGFQITRIDATSAHYADLASGTCDLVLECTRKGNLELAVGYALIREAGGVIVDMQGENLGPKKYLEFGQDRYVPFVASATQELADNLLRYLRS